MVDQTLELFDSGHRACGGCGAALAARLVTKAAGTNTIVVSATGCMEVFSTPYPETAWKVPWIHSLFENASAVAKISDGVIVGSAIVRKAYENPDELKSYLMSLRKAIL